MIECLRARFAVSLPSATESMSANATYVWQPVRSGATLLETARQSGKRKVRPIGLESYKMLSFKV